MQSNISWGIVAGSVAEVSNIEVLFADVSCSEVFNGSGEGTQRRPLCGAMM